jgi:hypothetical protein
MDPIKDDLLAERINKQLIDFFGIDTDSTNAIWRIVWSDEQFEWRKGVYDDITPAGIYLRTVEEVRHVPKYRQWIHQKYVLERLVAVPEMNREELPASKTSYEPIWVFADKYDNFLPPRIDACQFIINTIYAAQYGTKNLKKFIDPEDTTEKYLDNKKKETDRLVEELFGDQSTLGGETVGEGGSAIIVPSSYNKGVN